VLEITDLNAGYGDRPVLHGVTLTVADGEVVALLGPSGSGKSTLLRAVAGLIPVTAGTVRLDGVDITGMPTHRRGIGMVFQDEQLFPHRDVAGNVAFGLRMQGLDRPTRETRVAEMLAIVGLAGYGSRPVTELSGGEAKRVALARSIAPSPRALLLDEPLTGLDRELHDRLAVEVARILRAAATTALLVTHDHDEAAAIADRIVTIDELSGMGISVVELSTDQTYDLRRRVLRTGTPSSDVRFRGDDDPATTHLGLADHTGAVVAISSWTAKPCPIAPTDHDVQLRGMAVEPDLAGRGLGATLLTAGLDRAFAAGAETVWANARDTALDFYRRHGFEVVDDGFLDATTALAHHRIRRHRP
jgi:thiamine transport system ATP-binding protein